MRHLKMLGLAAIAAVALVAVAGAGSASATALCSTTGDPCPAGQKWPVNTAFDFSAKEFALIFRDTGGEELDKCTSATIKGKISNAGSSTETVTGPIEQFTFGSCTFPTTILSKGSLEVHKSVGTSNGTVTADGPIEATINTIPFGSCIYLITSGKSFGDLTEGKPAILHVNAPLDKISGSNIACPESIVLVATLTQTEPSNTTLSVSSS